MLKKSFLLILFTILSVHLFAQNLSTSQQIVNNTIRIEIFTDTIINGKPVRMTTTGTGFYFSFDINGKNIICIATNNHVINTRGTGALIFTESENNLPKIGSTFKIEIPNFNKMWIKHPTEDLAILPIGLLHNQFNRLQKKPFFRTLSETNLLTDSTEKSIDYIESVLMVGYPKGLIDTYNNLPIVRKGTTATSITLKYQNQPKFLVDIPIYPGSSGSPIFVYDINGSYLTKEGNIIMGSRFHLVGINAQSLNSEFQTTNNPQFPNRLTTSLPINIAVAIRATELLHFKPILKALIEKELQNH